MVPTRLKVAMARRSRSASAGVNPAATIAIRIACSWNSGTPSVLPQHLFKFVGLAVLGRRRRKLDLLDPLPPPQIGMHHVALDRPGPHDRDLDDEIVEFLRLQPRQHRHLRAALDLEHADGVGALDHAVDRVVFVLDAKRSRVDAVMRLQQIEAAPQAGQHAERRARRP